MKNWILMLSVLAAITVVCFAGGVPVGQVATGYAKAWIYRAPGYTTIVSTMANPAPTIYDGDIIDFTRPGQINVLSLINQRPVTISNENAGMYWNPVTNAILPTIPPPDRGGIQGCAIRTSGVLW